MKNTIKVVLQSVFGYERYLRAFAWFKTRTVQWDVREADFFHFLHCVPRDGLVLDIGANLGFLCVQLARRASQGRVLAFEPMPDNHRVLRWLLRRFGVGNVDVYPCALGDSNGEVSMVLPVHGRARQQGLGHVVAVGDQAGSGIRFDVPVQRLDDVPQVNTPGVRVAAIKMDVENFEQFVLRGAMRILERDRPLVYLELWDNENRTECFSIARNLGYEIMVFVNDRLVPFDAAAHRHGNFFFVHPSGATRPAVEDAGSQAAHQMHQTVLQTPASANCAGRIESVSKFPQPARGFDS